MAAAEHFDFVSEEDYLASELESEVKREYFAGMLFERAESTNRHCRITVSCLGHIGQQLPGKPSELFDSNTKVRVPIPESTRFYYPDVMIVSESNPDDDTYQEKPQVVFEVVSPTTRRVDAAEKYEAYLSLSSLDVYVMIDQDAPVAVIYRRNASGDFDRELLKGIDQVIELPTVEVNLPLAEAYEQVEFSETA